MHYHVYCDETCTDKGQTYMAFGGLMLSASIAASLKSKITQWRLATGVAKELKWRRVSAHMLDHYQSIAKSTFQHIHKKRIAFRSLVILKSSLDYKTHHGGDKELGYHKFMYQLLFHTHCRLMSGGDTMTVFLDDHQTTYDLRDLRDVLNTALCAKRRFPSGAIKRVEAISSKSSDFMQINDILLGAVGFHCNDRVGAAGGCPAKTALAKAIATYAGLPDLKTKTPNGMTHFGVWPIEFKKKKRHSP
jgi:hypothetical protein